MFLLISTGTFRTVRNPYCVVSRDYLLRFRFEISGLKYKVNGTSASPLFSFIAVIRIWIYAEPRTSPTRCCPDIFAGGGGRRKSGTNTESLCHGGAKCRGCIAGYGRDVSFRRLKLGQVFRVNRAATGAAGQRLVDAQPAHTRHCQLDMAVPILSSLDARVRENQTKHSPAAAVSTWRRSVGICSHLSRRWSDATVANTSWPCWPQHYLLFTESGVIRGMLHVVRRCIPITWPQVLSSLVLVFPVSISAVARSQTDSFVFLVQQQQSFPIRDQ